MKSETINERVEDSQVNHRESDDLQQNSLNHHLLPAAKDNDGNSLVPEEDPEEDLGLNQATGVPNQAAEVPNQALEVPNQALDVPNQAAEVPNNQKRLFGNGFPEQQNNLDLEQQRPRHIIRVGQRRRTNRSKFICEALELPRDPRRGKPIENQNKVSLKFKFLNLLFLFFVFLARTKIYLTKTFALDFFT